MTRFFCRHLLGIAVPLWLILTAESSQIDNRTTTSESQKLTIQSSQPSGNHRDTQRAPSCSTRSMLPAGSGVQLLNTWHVSEVQDDFEMTPAGTVLVAFQSEEEIDCPSNDNAGNGDLCYRALTAKYTFSSDGEPPFVILNTEVNESLGALEELEQSGPPSDLPSNPRDNSINEQSSTSESNRWQPGFGTVERPMSSIRLGAALSPVNSRGENLSVPPGFDDSKTPRIIENHFIAGNWMPSHPPRNEFPLRHQPLYFEDPNLERCGASNGCLTEFTSIAHFGLRIPLLAYLMASNPPHDCVQSLPDCPTCSKFGAEAYLPPPTAKAIAAQAASTTGLFFLIP